MHIKSPVCFFNASGLKSNIYKQVVIATTLFRLQADCPVFIKFIGKSAGDLKLRLRLMGRRKPEKTMLRSGSDDSFKAPGQ
jgi:hypothetical protein